MNPYLSIVTSVCLTAFASNCNASVNLQGTYSGTNRTINTGCTNPVHNGNWSQPFTLEIIQNNGVISSLPTTLTDPLTGVRTIYTVDNTSAKIDGKTANIQGEILANYIGGGNASSSFTGSAGTDFANASFTLGSSQDGCTKSSQISLTKIAGPRTGANNTAADAVQQAFAAGDSVLISAKQQTNNVKTRLNTLKHRSRQPKKTTFASNQFIDVSQLNVSFDGQSLSAGQVQNMLAHELNGGGASEDQDYNLDLGFGLFINGNANFGDRKSSTNQQGYDFDGAGVTLGGDYRFTDNFFMGVALGYSSSDADYEGDKGSLESNTYSAILYTTYNQPNGYFIDAVIRYGHSNIEGKRRFNTDANAELPSYQELALSDYSGNDYAIDLETGWEFIYQGLSLQPYVGVNLNYAQLEGYDEKTGSANTTGLLFHIDSQRAFSAQTVLGADISYAFSTEYAVIIPRFNFAWQHEFLSDYPRTVEAFTLGFENTTESTTFNDTISSDTFLIGTGLSASLPYGMSAFLNYNTTLSTRFLDSHNINGGIRWNF